MTTPAQLAGPGEVWWDPARQVLVGGNLDFNGSNIAGCHICGWRGQPRTEGGERSTHCPACPVDTHEATGGHDLRVCGAEDVYGRGLWASLDWPFNNGRLYRPRRRLAPVVALPKVGRNDPCSCGSGRKSKKCCGAVGRAA